MKKHDSKVKTVLKKQKGNIHISKGENTLIGVYNVGKCSTGWKSKLNYLTHARLWIFFGNYWKKIISEMKEIKQYPWKSYPEMMKRQRQKMMFF